MAFSNPIVGGEELIRRSIKSPNFVASVDGWSINRDGTIEANKAIIRGTLDIAGGVVTVNDAGIIITGTTNQFLINTGAGFKAKSIPDVGSFVAFQDQAAFFHVKDPSPVNAMGSLDGYISMDILNDTGVEYPYLELWSPAFDNILSSNERARVRLYATNNLRSGLTTIELNSDVTRYKGVLKSMDTGNEAYGKGWIDNSVRATDAIMAATEIVLHTIPSRTWEANRAYKVVMGSKYQAVSSGTQPSIFVRKGTTTAGTVLVNNGRLAYNLASTDYVPWDGIFITGSAVTSAIVVTGGPVAAGTSVTQVGTGTTPSVADVFDIGPASRYPGFGTLV